MSVRDVGFEKARKLAETGRDLLPTHSGPLAPWFTLTIEQRLFETLGAQMTEPLFKATIISAALVFVALFSLWCIPALIADPDIVGAFAAGFVNPYASGYAADTLACWVILSAWISYEAHEKGVRHGWVFALLGIVPGVAFAFAGYLLWRRRYVREEFGETTKASGTD